MLIPKDFPKVFFSDNGVFTDISLNALNFGESSSTVAVVAAEDKIYFGRVKPFSSIYVEMSTVNTNASTMTVKYYDGDSSSFLSVEDLVDETNGFTQSGFVQWKNPASDISGVTWADSLINSANKYWIEITFSADFSAGTALRGMNIVYSDDRDLNRVYDGVSNYFRTGTTTGILYHEQARKEIIQSLRNDGKFKVRLGGLNNDGMVDQIDEWDLHRIEEVNLWSTYLSLSHLFDNISVNADDNFARLSQKFYLKAQEMKKAYYLTLDVDDDGILDSNERLGSDNFIATVRRS